MLRMAASGFALFDTEIGRCAIAWGDRGVTGIQLPAAHERATRARVPRRFPGAREAPPPPDVRRAVEGISALIRGAASDLSAVALDMDGLPPFRRRVYEVARGIPPGTTLSYGDLAARLGERKAARAVGQALARNPFAIVVPCHRVVAAGGRIGGFSANGGVTTKLRLLSIESHVPPRPSGRAARRRSLHPQRLRRRLWQTNTAGARRPRDARCALEALSHGSELVLVAGGGTGEEVAASARPEG